MIKTPQKGENSGWEIVREGTHESDVITSSSRTASMNLMLMRQDPRQSIRKRFPKMNLKGRSEETSVTGKNTLAKSV